MDAVNQFLLDPKNHGILSILKGIRNGLVYGAKIRLPHAFVMTFLFRDQLTFRQKIKAILEATWQHSKNLGTFVGIYKSLLLLLKSTNGQQKEEQWHSFMSGLIGGYVVFGKDNNINQQIVLYLFSRIMVGAIKVLYARNVFKLIGLIPSEDFKGGRRASARLSTASTSTSVSGKSAPLSAGLYEDKIFPVFAAVVWGVVMYLFKWERFSLQSSLQASMQYLYNDSNVWSNFRNWLIHNQ